MIEEGWSGKRAFERVSVSFPLFYAVLQPLEARTDPGIELNAMAEDLSEGGMGLISRYPVPERALLQIRFELETPDNAPGGWSHAFNLQAEVRYRLEIDNRCRIGVRFLNISEKDRLFISRYVSSSRRDD